MSDHRKHEQGSSTPSGHIAKSSKSGMISKEEAQQLRPVIEGMFHDEAAVQDAMVSDIKRLDAESRSHKGDITFDASAFYAAHEKAIWGLLYDASEEENVNILRYLGRFSNATEVTSLNDLQEMLAHWARERVLGQEDNHAESH